MNRSFYKLMVFAVLFLTITGSQKGQVASNPPYTLEQSVVAGGGQQSTGGTFSLDGTIGQPVAGNASGGSSFSLTSGFWNFAASAAEALGFEADIANRPGGDSLFGSDDLIQLRRFLNGADTPDSTTNNEFQRADSAPYSSRGDGALCSNDLIQLRRYLNGADVPQTAGGPGSPIGNCGGGAQQTAAARQDSGKNAEDKVKANPENALSPAVARELRVESPPATSAGQTVTVNIRVDALGDEAAYSFRLNYNQTVLTNPVFNSGTTGAAIVDCDASITDRIGCTVEAFPTNNPASSSTSIREIGAGDNQLLLSITFTVASSAQAQTVALTLSNVSTSNDRAQNLTITATSGTVTIAGATAAPVSIGGRVMTASGRGIRNVTVMMIDSNGAARTAISTAFGYFQFNDVMPGGTYTFQARGKRFAFPQATQVRSVNEAITDLNFVADEANR